MLIVFAPTGEVAVDESFYTMRPDTYEELQ